MTSCPIPQSGHSIQAVGAVPPELVAQMRDHVAGHRITETVVRAALEAGHPLEDAVHMDEYTIDLVFRLAHEGRSYWLVYDTT